MGTRSLVSNSITTCDSPIAVREFLTALSSTLKINTTNHGSYKRRLGLAISGGVDSMALVSLCSRVQQSSNLTDIPNSRRELECLVKYSFQAFVVDHGIRQGSDVEAESVSKILTERGIPTRILKIQWREDGNPAESPNFESLARRYRFRVLGRACREAQIDSLLLAHHQDDQAETVLMRILNGHRMPGLMGIQGDSEIPECYGIHGVHMSGGIDDTLHSQSHQACLPNNSTAIRPGHFPSQLVIETGGVRVYRPLLNFTKARLQATCMADQMRWFEDPTNKDPTLTMRNAVRHMYANHTLPTALSKPALLSIPRKFKETAAADLLTMDSWLAESPVSHFDNRTGALTIRFRDLRNPNGASDFDKRHRHIAAKLLQQVISLVTPFEHVHISSLHGIVERIFPELWPAEGSESLLPQRFTVAGVMFTPDSPPHLSSSAEATGLQTRSSKCEWRISRQPHVSTHTKTPSVIVPARYQTSLGPKPQWSPWTLFDGRYWISVQNHTKSLLLIRPFRKEEYKQLQANFRKEERSSLRKCLKQVAPGDEKWTLPAIVGQDVDGEEKVLGLPTLDIKIPQADGQLRWRVRYKKVNLENLSFSQENMPIKLGGSNIIQ